MFPVKTLPRKDSAMRKSSMDAAFQRTAGACERVLFVRV